MNLAIDAFNIKSGGGFANLLEIVKSYQKSPMYFNKIVIFSSSETLKKLRPFPKIKKISTPNTNNLIYIFLWQTITLPRLLKKEKCEALLIPGGSSLTPFPKKFVMFQNMLPFDNTQLARYGLSLPLFKFILLRLTMTISFYFSKGIVFLTKEAKRKVETIISIKDKDKIIISHGIAKRFFSEPRSQKKIEYYSKQNRIKLTYVSNFDIYKNHINIILAVNMLAKENIPVSINFVGNIETPYNKGYSKKIKNLIDSVNSKYPSLLKVRENVSYSKIHNEYFKSDIFVYASTCENMPNILLESMASGLPILCSNYPPLKEILGRSGLYFDPHSIISIYKCLKKIIHDRDLRTKLANESFKKAKKYSWEESCRKLLKFIYIASK